MSKCPAKMSCGRHGTDYRPSCEVHSMIQQQNGISNQHEFRLFLQRRGDELLKLNRQHMNEHYGCPQTYYHVDPNGNDSKRRAQQKQLEQLVGR